eukprot:CAMPEP_0204107524 /NCGR_PEP_ID=MMETSP0361-20130328/182_1 /ASSEMBLY_ACC=CAM_ASM_000343 /TAXON_ID=268821 /ORGANISM="Scrippsiella Hangoei, Strain SHTV-5" /LENGTH=79 /DNA_ID=CAMNT_0051057017 /DNA_START=410 /DNA_END=646 /DNA_ORIENTATION=-
MGPRGKPTRGRASAGTSLLSPTSPHANNEPLNDPYCWYALAGGKQISRWHNVIAPLIGHQSDHNNNNKKQQLGFGEGEA